MLLRGLFSQKQHIGVSLISWATSIRWIGWGFVEYLIPIFMFSFTASYLGSGLLKSTYSIVFLLVLPLVGALANHVRAKYLILIGLLFYPFIALSYWLAGVFGTALFIIIARALNGIGYALDSTGRKTYFMRHVDKNKVGGAFGYFTTLAGFWWVASVLFSLVLIDHLEIHQLFLFIIPFTIIAFFLILKIPDDELDHEDESWKESFSLVSYWNTVREILLWKGQLRRLAIVSFFSKIMFAVTDFFMPIFLHSQGVPIEKIIIFMVIYSIPDLFGAPLGNHVDKMGAKAVPISFGITTLLIFMLGFASHFYIQLFIMFLIGVFGLMLELAISGETARLTKRGSYGSTNSNFSEIGEISAIIGPIALGFMIDFSNLTWATSLLAICGLLIFMALFGQKKSIILN